MKKLLTLVLCTALVFSMAFSVFAEDKLPKDPSSLNMKDLLDLLSGGSSEEEDTSGILGSISDALDFLKDSLPGLLDSIEEALPEIISSVQEALPGILESIPEDLGITQEEEKELQDLLDQISSATGDSPSLPLDPSVQGIAGSDDLVPDGTDKISGAADEISSDTAGSSLDSLLGTLSGIAGLSAADDPDEDPDAALPADGAMVGGWTVNQDVEIQLTDDQAAIFEKAEPTLAGGAYTPVAVIATQLVAGTNYAYLCLGAPDEPEDLAQWYIVTLYQDLSGNVTTLSIKDLELDDLETTNTVYSPAFVGSWTACGPEEEAPALPEDAQAAFDAAMEGFVGVGYSPIALLGTQLVAGTNYKILCYGTLVTKDPVTSWYIVDIYQDLEGESSVTDAQMFDLTEYIDYGGIGVDPADDIEAAEPAEVTDDAPGAEADE